MQQGSKENSLIVLTLFAALLVVGGFLAGLLAPHHFDAIVQPAIQKIEKIGSNLHGTPPWRTVVTIFVNNTVVAITLILLGMFLGIYPAWVMFMNGVVLGVVSALVIAKTHASLGTVLIYAILPHGIIELAALVWAAGLGFNLGFVGARSTVRLIFSRSPNPAMRSEQTFQGEVRRAVRSLPWIIGMLLIAACIEGLITPHLIQVAGL